MDVLLIEPPRKLWEMMGTGVAPPLGLAYIASALELEDVDVEILDCNALKLGWNDVKRVIERSKPEIVGVSALTSTFQYAAKTLRIAKEVDKEILTVVGGPHVTFKPVETLKSNPEIDVVVRGEGERTIRELWKAWRSKQGFKEVKGIAFRNGSDVVLTPPQKPVDVNEIPFPAYHLLPMDRYHFTVFDHFSTMITSRGCPYKCVFCSERIFWFNTWRPRKAESVGEELELLARKYGVKSVWFGDDCFNASPSHVQDVCKELIELDLDVSIFCQGRADLIVKHRELLPLMRKAGIRMCQIGVESAYDVELKSMGKMLSTQTIMKAVKLLKENEIISQGLIIIGTPDDDVKSIRGKMKFMKKLKIDFPIYTVYTPFPGTPLYEDAAKKGLIEVKDYSKYDMGHAIMPTKYITRKRVMKEYGRCFLYTYLDPKLILEGLLSKNVWKRKIWRHMLKYSIKQLLQLIL